MEKSQSLVRSFWEAWKRFGKRIGDFQARILLAIFYFVIVAPFALVIRSSDPLAIKDSRSRGWRPRENLQVASIEQAKRQF